MRDSVILDADRLRREVEYFGAQDAFVFDVETMPTTPGGEDRAVPRYNDVVWIALATRGRAIVVPMGHPNGNTEVTRATRRKNKVTGKFDQIPATFSAPPKQMTPSQVFEILRPLFFSDLIKIAHNATFDVGSIAKYYDDQIIPGPIEDTIVIQHLLTENLRSKGLKDLTEKYWGVKYDHENVGRCIEIHTFAKVAHYAYMDAKYTWLLWSTLRPRIDWEDATGHSLEQIHVLESDLIPVLVDMNLEGAPVDEDELVGLEKELSDLEQEVLTRTYQTAGKKFNMNAAGQKATLLFSPKSEGGQGLRPKVLTDGGKKKEKVGQALEPTDYSTAGDILEDLYATNDLVKCMIEYADVHKLLSTYVQGYLGVEDDKKKPCRLYDGRIHADLVSYGTVTGRFSCVAGDALVETPRDMSKHPDGIPISQMRAGDWVYAFDHERQLVLRKVKWVAQTGVKQTVIVTLQNKDGHQRTLRLTPEHLVMLRNGDWRPAANLLKAPTELTRALPRTVMTMVRRTVDGGYVKFFPNAQAKGNGSSGGGQNREHRWIMSQILGKNLSTKYDVDHIDGNKLNNHPSNLQYVPSREHRGNRKDFAWGTEQPEIDIYSGPLDYRCVSIIPGPIEPVWDMEVEDVHNFIANGVCVHNCREPNLQNIPRPDTALGKKIRGLFRAPEGYKLVVADYGQIEMILLAHLIGYGALFEGIKNGMDPHSATGAGLAGMDPAEFMRLKAEGDQRISALRQVAKGVNFAVVYGAGPEKVASMAGITVKEAKRFLEVHQQMFPEIYRFKAKVLKVAKERRPPHVRTILGRKRRLPALFSTDRGLRGYAERQAVNSLIQGSAADIIKLAMVRLHQSLEPDMKLILSVHDELVTLTPTDKAERCAEIVHEAMLGEGITGMLTVPLSSDLKIVDRWSAAK